MMDAAAGTVELRTTAVRKGSFDVEIVKAVQARRVLYDKRHEHHKNPRVKEVEWTRIGEELGVPASAIIKRWTVIRERFASEKRKIQQLGPSSWWLIDHMNWLDEHIQPRQRGKMSDLPANLTKLPDLTHISHLSNLPPLTSIADFNNFNRNNTSIRYADEPDDDDARSASPIMSIAYPEVCMKNISSDEEDESYNSAEDRKSFVDEERKMFNADVEIRKRRATNGSEDSQGPLNLGLDLDEAAAARMMAALKSIDDPLVRHRFRQKVHRLAEECEFAALQTTHIEKKRKEI